METKISKLIIGDHIKVQFADDPHNQQAVARVKWVFPNEITCDIFYENGKSWRNAELSQGDFRFEIIPDPKPLTFDEVVSNFKVGDTVRVWNFENRDWEQGEFKVDFIPSNTDFLEFGGLELTQKLDEYSGYSNTYLSNEDDFYFEPIKQIEPRKEELLLSQLQDAVNMRDFLKVEQLAKQLQNLT